jgi:hypothetical protein
MASLYASFKHRKNIFIFILCLISILLPIFHSEQVAIFEQEGEIEFAKILDYEINFGIIKQNTPNFFIEHSFLSIIANVTTGEDCGKKSVKIFITYNNLYFLVLQPTTKDLRKVE